MNKDSRGVSRVDGGCRVFATKNRIEEEKRHCDCNNCEYKQYTHSCMSNILNAFIKPIVDKYQELRKDLSSDYINEHYKEFFPSMK